MDFEGSIAVIGELVCDGSVDDKEFSLTVEVVSDEVLCKKMFTFKCCFRGDRLGVHVFW